MKRILFLCTGNACRSQMAEGWGRKLCAGKAEVFSGGTRPGREVDPRAVKAMAEAGVDISAQRAKSVDSFKGVDFDLVVTVCDNANQACPAYWGPGKRLHRGFDDPATVAGKDASEEAAMQVYRRVRDEIRALVEGLCREL